MMDQLQKFAQEAKMLRKGPLCVALVITRHAIENALPLDPDQLLTDNKGQVKGLGKSSVQKILKEYGIHRVLAEEGGRTSRGSIGNMRQYVAFLNGFRETNLSQVEAWWVDQVRAFFASKPFVLRTDLSLSLQAMLRDLLEQAKKLQKENPGTMYEGALLQHLTGAMLELCMDRKVEHHGASVADRVTGREGDFLAGDCAIHVTCAPGEALIRKCESNLEQSLRPIILTTGPRVIVARALAEQRGLLQRIDVFEIEQFLSLNLFQRGRFQQKGGKEVLIRLMETYNRIVETCETDPSLRIRLGG